LTKQTERTPAHDAQLENLVLGGMLASPVFAKMATEELDGGVFYLPGSKAAFDVLSLQYARSGGCDEYLLRDDLMKRGWASAEAQEYAELIGRASMQCSIMAGEGYFKRLIELEAERRMLTAASEMLSGKQLGAVARELSELATERGSIQKSSLESLANEIEDEIAGKRRAIRFPTWPILSTTQALLPGTLTILCGSPGVSKSFFSVEPLWRWAEGGEQVAALELESGANYHLRRIHAQMAGNGRLTQADWCKANADQVRALIADYADRLHALKPVVQSPNDNDRPTCDYLTNWIRARCIEGCRVLVIDPITMMETGERGFNDHQRFVSEAKSIIKRYGASLILVTHPKRGMPGNPILPCLENLPNSSAYERFSDTIFWLEYVEPSVETFVDVTGISTDKQVNRYLHCLKVRLSKNPGRIAFFFDATSLRHVECGVL
jgi:replicative DNA helicase